MCDIASSASVKKVSVCLEGLTVCPKINLGEKSRFPACFWKSAFVTLLHLLYPVPLSHRALSCRLPFEIWRPGHLQQWSSPLPNLIRGRSKKEEKISCQVISVNYNFIKAHYVFRLAEICCFSFNCINNNWYILGFVKVNRKLLHMIENVSSQFYA